MCINLSLPPKKVIAVNVRVTYVCKYSAEKDKKYSGS